MVSSIIVAAGSGKRMGKSINKVYLDLNGYPVLFHSIRAFQEHPEVDEIILVLKESEIEEYIRGFSGYGFTKVRSIAKGGTERMDSVRNGLAELSPDSEIVLIHDGARPLITEELITKAIGYAREYGAACPAVTPKDTIKLSDSASFIERELPRQELRAVQTPQAFKTSQFRELMENALKSGRRYTDDTSVFVEAGRPVYLYPGSYDNLKITTAEDLELCRILSMKYE